MITNIEGQRQLRAFPRPEQEDKGLWEKGDLAIERLEARAYADFKGRRVKPLFRRCRVISEQ